MKRLNVKEAERMLEDREAGKKDEALKWAELSGGLRAAGRKAAGSLAALVGAC